MRKTVLLLAAMVMALMLASGAALAVTKHCGESKCVGTNESDRLLGNAAYNFMIGRGGNDTLKGRRGERKARRRGRRSCSPRCIRLRSRTRL